MSLITWAICWTLIGLATLLPIQGLPGSSILPGPGRDWPGTKTDVRGRDVIVETSSGTVKGKIRNHPTEAGWYIEKVQWFLGIPYAAPPVDALRFEAPEPMKRWTGIRNATRFGRVCTQTRDFGVLDSSEDCLTLNIFTPIKPGVSSWPVMVYIHGGSYSVGTGASYLGHILAQQGVVVVTINYRIGILGFLSTRNKHLPGNYGLLDQIEALKWIRENIGLFGGDPEQVTLFGHHSGATSVGILSLSPLAKGLFRRVIIQSGSPISPWAAQNESVDMTPYTRQVAEHYNCSRTFLGPVVRCLREVPVEKYTDQDILSQIPDISVSNINFRPLVDGHVMPKPVRRLLETGEINPEVVMIGVSHGEWSTFSVSMIQELMAENHFDNKFSDGFNRSSFEEAVKHISGKFGWDSSIASTLIHRYTEWDREKDPVVNRRLYYQLINDLVMNGPTIEFATLLVNRGIPVYLYDFDHRSAVDTWKTTNTDVHYVFGGPFMDFNVVEGLGKKFSEESQDKEMSRVMMSLWKDFAKYGVPSQSTPNQLRWTQFNPSSANYALLNLTNMTMVNDFHHDGVSFWNDVIPGLLTAQSVPYRPWYEPNILVWLLVAVASLLLLIVFVLSIVLCVRKRQG